jgi:hypothetical protein
MSQFAPGDTNVGSGPKRALRPTLNGTKPKLSVAGSGIMSSDPLYLLLTIPSIPSQIVQINGQFSCRLLQADVTPRNSERPIGFQPIKI